MCSSRSFSLKGLYGVSQKGSGKGSQVLRSLEPSAFNMQMGPREQG